MDNHHETEDKRQTKTTASDILLLNDLETPNSFEDCPEVAICSLKIKRKSAKTGIGKPASDLDSWISQSTSLLLSDTGIYLLSVLDWGNKIRQSEEQSTEMAYAVEQYNMAQLRLIEQRLELVLGLQSKAKNMHKTSLGFEQAFSEKRYLRQ